MCLEEVEQGGEVGNKSIMNFWFLCERNGNG